MNATINIRTDAGLKSKAQKVAGDLGFNLSSLLNAYLRHLVKTKVVHFSLEERPNAYLRRILKRAEKDIKEGKVSPAFDNVDEAIKWLNR